MQHSDSIFFMCCAIVLTALILSMGFGHCSSDSEGLAKYKICMENAKDPKLCGEAGK